MAVSISIRNKPAVAPLSLVPNQSISFRCENNYRGDAIKRLYHADNLDVLHYLLNDEKVLGHVNLIYIDPPYNTGGVFETRDFKHAYTDKYTM